MTSEGGNAPRQAGGGLLCLAILAACSGGDAPDPTGAAGTRSGPADASAAHPDAAEDATLWHGRLRQLPEWGDDLRRRIDPGADGWPTEVFAVRAEQDLRAALTEALAGRVAFSEAFAAVVDPTLALTALVPADPETVFEDGEFQVRKAPPAPSAEAYGRDALDELGAAWRASFATLAPPRVQVEIDRLEQRPDGTIETELKLRVDAERGARLQQNLRWACSWTRNGEKLVRLRRLGFEEVRAAHRPFVELTRAVFGAEECFAREILMGNGDYHMRQDRTCKQPYLGMHGIAIADVNGDGLEDVYVGQPGGQPNRLFLHQPDGTARDASAEAEVDLLDNTGPVLLVDLDGDGAREVLSAVGANVVIAWNDGTGRFAKKSVLAGEGVPEISTMSAADPDGDGDLDLFAGRYVAGGLNGGVPLPYFDADNGADNFYWRNDGERRFTEASAEVGLDVGSTRFTLASIWDDFDDDGDQDLYVVNDFGSNLLFRNDAGRFTEIAAAAGVLDTAAGMGAATGDVNLDGRLDLYVTNMTSSLGSRVTMQPRFQAQNPDVRDEYMYHARGNTLLIGNGDGTWTDVSVEAGVSPGDWAWGGNFLDWNNDGYEDIVVPNGFVSNRKQTDLWSFMWRCVAGGSPLEEPSPEYAHAWEAIGHFSSLEGYSYAGHERNFAYLNMGDLRFADASFAAALDFLDDGRAAATVDWDDDGRVDLLLRNRTGPRLRLLRNDHGRSRAFVGVELVGTVSNRDAIGAKVTVEAGGRTLRQVVQAGEGFLCASSFRLYFGLGAAERIERIRVRWPAGAVETFEDVAAGRRYRIVEGAGAIEPVAARAHPGLAALEGEELPLGDRPNNRIVLLDRLPLDPIRLPALRGPAARGEGQAPRIADYRGRALVIAVGPFERPQMRGVLESWAPVAAQLAESGIDIVAVSLTAPDAFERSRKAVEALGLTTNTAPADAFRTALEVAVVEVLGPYDALPMPLVLAIDAAGQLCVLYCGRVHPQRIIDDLVVVGPTLERLRGTEGLTGGRWGWRPERGFGEMAEVFEFLGDTEKATFYRAREAERK